MKKLVKGFSAVSEKEMLDVNGGFFIPSWVKDALDTDKEKQGFNFKFPLKVSYKRGNTSVYIESEFSGPGRSKSAIVDTPIGSLNRISIGCRIRY